MAFNIEKEIFVGILAKEKYINHKVLGKTEPRL